MEAIFKFDLTTVQAKRLWYNRPLVCIETQSNTTNITVCVLRKDILWQLGLKC